MFWYFPILGGPRKHSSGKSEPDARVGVGQQAVEGVSAGWGHRGHSGRADPRENAGGGGIAVAEGDEAEAGRGGAAVDQASGWMEGWGGMSGLNGVAMLET